MQNNMTKDVTFSKLNGSRLRIGIAVSRWNHEITDALLHDCLRALEAARVKKKNIAAIDVPGSFELPYAALRLIKDDKVDAVVCLGCLIKGETRHFECIAAAVSNGIMQVQLDTGVPVIFGVLTCLNEAQARERSVGKGSHAYAWGLSAVEMGLLRRSAI